MPREKSTLFAKKGMMRVGGIIREGGSGEPADLSSVQLFRAHGYVVVWGCAPF